MRNIILIGMPGSGKTTIGRALAKKADLAMIDLDDYIEAIAQMKISEMFEISEAYFRDYETKAAYETLLLKDTIIATGGGVILREENMEALKKGGTIYYLDRDLEKIVNDVNVSQRPLLKRGKHVIYELYETRHALYEKYKDVKIDNNGTIEETVAAILKYEGRL